MTTATVICQPNIYTLVGQGPLTLSISNGPNVWVINSATQPSNTTGGITLSSTTQDFTANQLVWAMPIPNNEPFATVLNVSYDLGNTTGTTTITLGSGTSTVGTVNLTTTQLSALESVTITALPALPAGTNTIGQVLSEDAPLASIIDSTTNSLYVYFLEAPAGTTTATANAWRVSRLTVANGQTQWVSSGQFNQTINTGTVGSPVWVYSSMTFV